MPEIVLTGCAPIPLAAYLKALGVFRLVAEQADKDARGCWRDEAFILATTLTRDGLICFFLDDYCPSPVISPWNGRAGFLEGDDEEESTRGGAELVRSLGAAIAPRFAALKNAVAVLSELHTLKALNALRDEHKRLEVLRKRGELSERELSYMAALKKREGALKRVLIGELRGTVPEQIVEWMDACWRIGATEEKAPPAPLLGSGGNDGSRDLGLNFGQQLANLFGLHDPRGSARPEARSTFMSAAFGAPSVHLKAGTIGQFAPAQAGPNAGVGFGADAPLNPWDTVLSIEGSIVFGGATTRRLGHAEGESSFPFTVRATGAAGGGSTLSDEREARGEIWVPLWRNFASFSETAALFSEGRATLRRMSARDGIDFVRAAVTLGVNRGICSFQRYGFMKREGRNYIAAPLTRISVRHSRLANLINDLDQQDWLQRFRAYSRSNDAPGRLQSIAGSFDEAIFAMARDATPQSVQRALIAAGEAAAYLASSSAARDPKRGNQNPPPRLSRAWFDAANDGTAEFRIAAALAGLGRSHDIDDQIDGGQDPYDEEARPTRPVGAHESEQEGAGAPAKPSPPPGHSFRPKLGQPPLCAHLAPLDETAWYSRYRSWGGGARLTAWSAGPLDRNLAAILGRRLLFAARHNDARSPFDARAPADLASVLAFLDGRTDDAKIAALALGLAWADPPALIRTHPAPIGPLPLVYALMKPLFAPPEQLWELGALRHGAGLPIPPGLVQRLRSGDIGAAIALACRRARASGLPVTFGYGAPVASSVDGRRMLAALLIPIRTTDLTRTLERAHPALFDNGKTPQPTEGPANVA